MKISVEILFGTLFHNLRGVWDYLCQAGSGLGFECSPRYGDYEDPGSVPGVD